MKSDLRTDVNKIQDGDLILIMSYTNNSGEEVIYEKVQARGLVDGGLKIFDSHAFAFRTLKLDQINDVSYIRPE